MKRSALHQSRIKNPAMQSLIKLFYKYRARSISELFDKCTADEFASVIYAAPFYHQAMQPSLELFIKDSLEIQRRNRWEYMCAHAVYNHQEETELLRLFDKQLINIIDFQRALKSVLLCDHPKKNCLKLWGSPNSGKSLLAQLICNCFISCYANNHGSENEFFLSNFLNKSIILCVELYITQATCEDFKSILAGAPIDICKKFQEKQILSRTPVIVTSNFSLFGRGHLSPMDENALQLRCNSFMFSAEFTPSCQITAPSFYHLMWLADNQDVL